MLVFFFAAYFFASSITSVFKLSVSLVFIVRTLIQMYVRIQNIAAAVGCANAISAAVGSIQPVAAAPLVVRTPLLVFAWLWRMEVQQQIGPRICFWSGLRTSLSQRAAAALNFHLSPPRNASPKQIESYELTGSGVAIPRKEQFRKRIFFTLFKILRSGKKVTPALLRY